jgi:GNAT superfamily N-acetyltransferase
VPAAATFALRQRVLRPHQRTEELAEPDDDAPDTRFLAVRDADGAVVATGSVRRTPQGWQVRQMATDPAHRGQGLAAAVLDGLLDHVRAAGGGPVWCAARTPAVGFYERRGFVATDERWVDPDLGPHVRMCVNIGPPSQDDTEGGAA